MECIHCHGALERSHAPLSIDRNGYHVHWDALPAWVCRQCGEPCFDAPEVDRVQRALATLDREACAEMPEPASSDAPPGVT